MKRLFLVLCAVLMSSGLIAQQKYPDLIISEYFEGTGNNKALEIYNGTGQEVDLSQYSWMKETNGAGGYKPMAKTVMSGMLANGATYVIVCLSTNPPTDPALLAKANLQDNGGVTGFNGNDAIALCKGSTVIDAIGVLGNPADWGKDVDMRRTCEKGPKPIYDATEWETFKDLTDYSNLGKHCGPDGDAPQLRGVSAQSTTSLNLTFNEKITKVTAEAVANYSINKSVTVSAAVLDATEKVVSLTISAINKGEAYILTVSNIADPTGNIMNPPAVDTFSFGSTPENTCATLSELQGKTADNKTVYTITGPVEIIAVGSQRGQKWIADATGGMLIDDPNGIVTETFVLGDNLSTIQGTLEEYFGLLEFHPTANPVKAAPTVKVKPSTITLAKIKAGGNEMKALTSTLIKVEKVKFPDVASQFANGKNYRLNDGTTNDSLLRTHLYGVDYIGKTVPSGMQDITGVVVYSREKYYIVPRFEADMVPHQDKPDTVANETLQAVSFTVYPNPTSNQVQVNITEGGIYTVNLFNMAGVKLEEIKGVNGRLTLDLNRYGRGVYMIQVSDRNKVSTTKVVKK